MGGAGIVYDNVGNAKALLAKADGMLYLVAIRDIAGNRGRARAEVLRQRLGRGDVMSAMSTLAPSLL